MVRVNCRYFLTKVFKTDENVQEKRPPFAILVFFHNNGFDYINLRSTEVPFR